MAAIYLEPAYILHTRPFRDTSLLIDFFTPTYGRLAGIKKGIKRAKSPLLGLVQPCVPLLVSWVGRGEMKTLTSIEARGTSYRIQGKALMSALYINELLMRLLSREIGSATLFSYYQQLLINLNTQSVDRLAGLLRSFEKRLLEVLGYGLTLDQELHTGKPVEAKKFYQFDPIHGLSAAPAHDVSSGFLGAHVLAVHRDEYHEPGVLQVAKQILYASLQSHLGEKPLQSWTLWRR